MNRRQFTGKEIIENSFSFIKEQLTNRSLLLINFMSNLVIIGIVLVSLFLSIFVKLASIFFSFSLLKDIIIFLILFLYIFVVIKLLKQIINFGNIIMLNSLDAALHRPMRRFEQGDDRLGLFGFLFLMIFLFILGLLFLIIPGIYFIVRAFMSYPIYLEEKCSPFQAIKRSFEMTKGNFWPLLIPVSINCFLNLFPVLNIINILIPFSSWNTASMYALLKNR